MSNPNPDTKSKSISESAVSTLASFPIAYGITIIILPMSTGWINESPFIAGIGITAVFALVSFFRVYALRRVFEKLGYDDNFYKIIKKLTSKKKKNTEKLK